MLNKNDPLIGAVKQVMQQSDAERAAVKAVNEKFGIQDRKALPWQKQSEWDAAYKKVLSEGVSVLNEDTQIDDVLDTDEKKLSYAKKAYGQIKKLPNDGNKKSSKRITGLQLLTKKSEKKTVKKESVEQHPSIESIQEEIANNLMERAKSIHETQGEAGLQAFFESLTEEQIAILQMNELFGAVGAYLGGAANAATGGMFKKAYAGAQTIAKNTAAAVGIGKGTTYSREYDQETEKEKAHPVATGLGRLSTPLGAAGALAQGVKDSVMGKATASPTDTPPKPTPKPADLNTKTSTTPATTPKAKSVKSIHSTATKSSGMKAPVTKTKIVAKPKVSGTPASRLQSRNQRDSEVGPRR